MNVLITGIGGDIAQATASILKECRPDLNLYGSDVDLCNAGALFVNQVIQVPRADSDNYIDVLKKIINEFSIDIFIPITEPELYVIASRIDELKVKECLALDKDIISVGLDKLKTMEALTSLGVPIPWTHQADEKFPIEYPCIFKAQRGYGSKNVFIVEDQHEASYLRKKYPDSIFQELLLPASSEITCTVYRAKDGSIAVLQLQRKLTGGLTGWAEVINDQSIYDMCKQIAIGLNLYGSLNIQLIMTPAGPRVFEINPRFSSTVLMRHILGFSDLIWTMDELFGGDINYPEILSGRKIVRVHDAQIL